MPGRHYSDKTRSLACEHYAKYGLNEASRRLEGVISRSQILRIAREEGIKPPTLDQKKRNTGGVKVYNKARRQTISDRLFKRLETVLRRKGVNIEPTELKALAVTFAVLTDKRRLEDGEANVIMGEQYTPEEIVEDGERRLAKMENEYKLEFDRRHKGNSKRKGLISDLAEERARRNGA